MNQIVWKSGPSRSSLNKSCVRSSRAVVAQAKYTTLPKTIMERWMLFSLLQQQSASDVDIQTFSGDPWEYHFFITLFREAVVCKKIGPHARLVHFLKFTDGEAKETIRQYNQ